MIILRKKKNGDIYAVNKYKIIGIISFCTIIPILFLTIVKNLNQMDFYILFSTLVIPVFIFSIFQFFLPKPIQIKHQ